MRSLLICILALAGPRLSAQTDNCNCGQIFEKVIQKINDDYIGYALTKKNIEKDYNIYVETFREQVAKANLDHCTSIIQKFLRYFKDGHLFVSEIPTYSDSSLAVFKANLKSRSLDTHLAINYLISQKLNLQPVEGVWTDGSSRFAVIKNTDLKWPYQYIAIILHGPDKSKIGEVKFGVNLVNNELEGTYYTSGYAPRYTTIHPVRMNEQLDIFGGPVWRRINFTDEFSILDLSLSDPKLPEVKKLDSLFTLITIPTFLVEKPSFDKALYAHESDILGARYLIIDIRGNGGGNAVYWDLLSFYSDSTRPIADPSGLALVSKDNLAYFIKNSSYSGDNPFIPVVKAMQQKQGQIIPGPVFPGFSLPTRKSNIQKVIILTDHSNASAAETFVLHSKQVSDKVITAGEPSGGVIDYVSVNIIDLNCGARGISLGYPTYSRTAEAPNGGFNKTGIRPDLNIAVDPNKWVDFIKNYCLNK